MNANAGSLDRVCFRRELKIQKALLMNISGCLHHILHLYCFSYEIEHDYIMSISTFFGLQWSSIHPFFTSLNKIKFYPSVHFQNLKTEKGTPDKIKRFRRLMLIRIFKLNIGATLIKFKIILETAQRILLPSFDSR